MNKDDMPTILDYFKGLLLFIVVIVILIYGDAFTGVWSKKMYEAIRRNGMESGMNGEPIDSNIYKNDEAFSTIWVKGWEEGKKLKDSK